MILDLDEEGLKELEAQLYSQIHYGNSSSDNNRDSPDEQNVLAHDCILSNIMIGEPISDNTKSKDIEGEVNRLSNATNFLENNSNGNSLEANSSGDRVESCIDQTGLVNNKLGEESNPIVPAIELANSDSNVNDLKSPNQHILDNELNTELDEEALRELEERLYSQVYHAHTEENTENSIDITSFTENSNSRYQPRRYYNSSIFAENNRQREVCPSYSSSPNSKSSNMNFGANNPHNHMQNIINISPVIQIQTPPNPVNNIIVVSPNVAKFLANDLSAKEIKVKLKKQMRRLKRKQAKKRKAMDATLGTNDSATDNSINTSANDRTGAKDDGLMSHFSTYKNLKHSNSKSSNQKLFDSTKINESKLKTVSDLDKIEVDDNDDVIFLSDEDEICVISSDEEDESSTSKLNLSKLEDKSALELTNEIMPDANVVSETKPVEGPTQDPDQKHLLDTFSKQFSHTTDDDVVIIEPKPAEIINIDPDPEPSQVVLDLKVVADADASALEVNAAQSLNSSDSIASSAGVLRKTFGSKAEIEKEKERINQIVAERRELGTPDSSTSNDFIDNSLVTQQNRFNFNLHGSDFGTFIRPKAHNEIYETESSCSAVSDNVTTPSKCNIFTEIEFDAPRELFSEENLDSFSKFITPKHNTTVAESPRVEASTSSHHGVPKTPQSVHKLNKDVNDNSDSSTESEYGDTSVEQTPSGRRKRLPSLSPMPSDNESNNKYNQTLTHKSKSKAKKLQKKLKDIACGDKENNLEKEVDNSKTENLLEETNEEIDSENVKRKKKRRSSNNKDIDTQLREENNSSSNNIDSEPATDINEISSDNLRRKKKRKNDGVESNDDKTNSASKKKIKKKNSKCDSTQVFSVQELKSPVVSSVREQNTTVNIDDDTNLNKLLLEIDEDIENMDCLEDEINSTNDVIIVEQNNNPIVIDDDDDNENKNDDNMSVTSRSAASFIGDVSSDIEIVNCSTDPLSYQNYEKQNKTGLKKTFSNFWSEDMNTFYRESWGLEKYSVTEEHKGMSDDPHLWKILDRDRINIKLLQQKSVRCRRCRELGHYAVDCPNKQGPEICRLCGGRGHSDIKCRNKLCSNCGSQGHYSTVYCKYCIDDRGHKCTVCRTKGHIEMRCPDLWRRYHLTTEEGPLKQHEGSFFKPQNQRWCSGCGSNGHFEFHCSLYNRTYPKVDPTIRNYEDIYQSSSGNNEKQSSDNQVPNPFSHSTPKKNETVTNRSLSIQDSSQKLPESLPIVNNTPVHNNQELLVNPFSPLPKRDPKMNVRSQYCGPIQNENLRSANSLAMDEFIPLDSMDLRNVIHQRNITRDIQIPSNTYTSLNDCDGLEIYEPNPQNEHRIYYLNLNTACFLLYDLPGNHYLDDLATKVGIIIDVVIRPESGLYFLDISGPLDRANFARKMVDIYIYNEVPELRVPNNSTSVYDFIENFFSRTINNYNPKEILNNIIKIKSRRESCTDYRVVTDLGTELRQLYIQLNLSLFCKYKLEESEMHMNRLIRWRDKFANSPFMKLRDSDRNYIQVSYNYLIYNRRKIPEYRTYIKRLQREATSLYISDLPPLDAPSTSQVQKSKSSTAVEANKIKPLRNMRITIEGQYKHFLKIRKFEKIPDHFLCDLPKQYSNFQERPQHKEYSIFKHTYLKLLEFIRKDRDKK